MISSCAVADTQDDSSTHAGQFLDLLVAMLEIVEVLTQFTDAAEVRRLLDRIAMTCVILSVGWIIVALLVRTCADLWPMYVNDVLVDSWYSQRRDV